MAKRQIDGSIRMRDGRILYANSMVDADTVLELFEMLEEAKKVVAGAEAKHAETSKILDNRIISSQFTGANGISYDFEYLYPRDISIFRHKGMIADYLALELPGSTFPLEEDIPQALDYALREMRIEMPNRPIKLWMEACLTAVYTSRLSRLGKASSS